MQSEIRARLRHGLTQTELAQEFGIAICTLNNILKGHREPSAKVLKLLGIRRQIVYVLEEDHDIPEGLAARAPLPRAKRRKAANVEMPTERVTQRAGLPAKAREWGESKLPQLTTERVLVAVKFKLNPRDTWTMFWEHVNGLESNALGDFDSAWEQFCSEHGSPPSTAKSDPVMYASLGKGDAVALKPVTARQDFRRPRKLGELPAIAVIDQPEVAI
ncbi:MAG TPA: helix-turn-helix transcriptional regulator [Bryobacteraceae bacterium]|nr:helix-turn-helix transcriptional regulator [Bryobacteraceae bacterium]